MKEENHTNTDKVIDFISSIKIDRTIFIFLMFSIILHWNFFYSLFFIKQEYVLSNLGLLKNEWLLKRFFLDNILLFNLPQYVVYVVIYFSAGILTWFYIYYLQPRVLEKTAKKLFEHKYNLELSDLDSKKSIIDKEVSILEQEKTKNILITEMLPKKDDILLWQKDFLNFLKGNFFKDFETVIDAVYSNSGRSIWYEYNNGDEREVSRISSGLLSYLHAEEVISFTGEHKDIVEFTQKGMYFIKKYQEIKSMEPPF